jgi:hypothetical protein
MEFRKFVMTQVLEGGPRHCDKETFKKSMEHNIFNSPIIKKSVGKSLYVP